MCPADLGFCDELRALSGWNQRIADWKRFLDFSPNGCFVAARNSQVAGTVTTTQYGREVAWIGMLLVHPDARGNGIGKALLAHAIDYLRAHGIASIKLDATPLGEALYRKLGFREEWGLTRFAGNVSSALEENGSEFRERIGAEIHNAAIGDIDRFSALDSEAFGAERRALISSLQASAKVALVSESMDGLKAFGFLRHGSVADYLGPVIARDSESATGIIIELLRRSESRVIYWDIPAPNTAAMDLATRLGFVAQRPLLRMFLGGNRTGNASMYYGICDPSLG
jgi:GNAT superfamily N-acetyltransferase